MTQGEARGANMKQGAVIETGNPLDVALSGRTMLAVQGEDGEEAYTRRGDLTVDASGVMSNGDGRPVIGDAGPITVPPGARITIAPDGSVLAATPENPDQPPQVVGRIKLVGTAGSRIEKGLDGLFRVFGGGALPADEEAKVQSGALEQSNVDPTRILVEMVEAQRLFDMRTKLIATARELDEGGAGLMRLG
jgi:flagellar basal-body rod protein FlgF